MFMKRFILIILSAVILANCASSEKVPEPEEEPELSFLEAIEQSAWRIASVLPARSRVAIIAFESESDNLSDFIKEELTGALFIQDIEIADRQNLEYVFKELNLQVSGGVSDAAAQSIGRFFGVQYVVTGRLTYHDDSYLLYVRTINVNRAVRDSFTRLIVRNDDETNDLIATINSRFMPVRTSEYSVSEDVLPLTAGTLLDRGILFLSRDDYEKAISDFSMALELEPNLSSAIKLRGRALFRSATLMVLEDDEQAAVAQMQMFDQALNDFSRAIQLEPGNASLFRERGRVYGEKGDFNRAILDFNQAVRLNPNFAEAFNNRGTIFSNMRDFDRAIADFTQSIQLNPSYAEAYFNRGSAFYEISDYDRALADFEIVLLIIPNDENARMWLENARQQRGR
jgi:tetratricopeptide (TPR) repeat protein